MVVDVETSGLHPEQNALLEMAVVMIDYHPDEGFVVGESFSEHILPYDGAQMDPKSLAFNKISPKCIPAFSAGPSFKT